MLASKFIDKTIILTGAAGGIGTAVARQCLGDGATVIACDNNEKKLSNLKYSLNSVGLKSRIFDISDYYAIQDSFNSIIQDNPEVSILINNAGIYLGKNIIDYSEDEINKVISVNIKGTVYLAQLFGKHLISRKRNGIIINISSIAGQEGSSDAIYGMTKAAIIGLTKSLAMNFSPLIRVNAIAPALVDTEMITNIPDWRIKQYRESELIKEPILPEDVANTVKFLISDESKHYTGAVFDLNNGCYLR